ncbi:hypothetical protein [Shewanella algae]|uniref:hypothetical protein n=1 Tax=Shewanella algae TaxID=38313 RepID=UPI0011833620|nr:hypothetical protein [Shewanella algae]TVO88306.1 hypothetical protein AYI76_02940 [Shewanella algae]TVO89912.1 hypothetical protein AYI78_02940 [Shewanella algae]TVO99904.1 hypothetical protein AYI79_02940 [Shewanella algae]
MKLILLDRNAVATIKENLNGKSVDINRLKTLRNLDNKKNHISPILSIIEGQIGKRETKEEMMLTLKKEADAISEFYRRATKDSEYLLETADSMCDVFSNHNEHKWDNYVNFLTQANPILFQNVAKHKKQESIESLLSLAKANNIYAGHPTVIICLSILFGSNEARSVLKPKKDVENFKSYNAVSDIILISRICHIKAIFSQSKKSTLLKFITFDEGLEFFLKSIRVLDNKIIQDGGVEIEAEYSHKLFPGLTKEEFTSFMVKLKNDS